MPFPQDEALSAELSSLLHQLLRKAPKERFRISHMRRDPFLTEGGNAPLPEPEGKIEVRHSDREQAVSVIHLTIHTWPFTLDHSRRSLPSLERSLPTLCLAFAHARCARTQANVKLMELKAALSSVMASTAISSEYRSSTMREPSVTDSAAAENTALADTAPANAIATDATPADAAPAPDAE